jgi:uncharacterized protein (DUF58 family)
MPTRKTFFWFAAGVVLYLIAWNIGSGWLYIITALLVSFPLVSLVLSRLNVQKLEVAQTAVQQSVDGGAVESTLRIVNRSLLPRFFLAIDCRFGGSRKHFFLPSAGGNRSLDHSVKFAPLRRGIYPGSEITVTSSAPLGLVKCRRRLQTSCQLAVYPAWHHLGGDWESGYMYAGAMKSSNAPTRTASSDYLGVRDYRSEDSPRSIHWRTTARNARLSVIEYARQAVMTPVFILDSWKGFSRNGAAFENAVSAAATLVMRETANNRLFGIGSSPDDARERELGHDTETAMFWLAGIEAGAEAPLDLETSLPWPDAIPVLLLSSHVAYRQVYRSLLLAGHPHAIVIIFDLRGFQSHGVDAANLMDDHAMTELAGNLDRHGSRLLMINSSDHLVPCLQRL